MIAGFFASHKLSIIGLEPMTQTEHPLEVWLVQDGAECVDAYPSPPASLLPLPQGERVE